MSKSGRRFASNEMISTWKVEKMLGEGGFGAVYEVENDKKEKYALKTEDISGSTHVLKMEVIVLRALRKVGSIHCCDIFDAGRARGMNFLVMTLIGRSIDDLRKRRPQKCFTSGCAISIGKQSLSAIQDLHRTGFLHRDIKPANFAIALDDPRRILIFDFGMCRRYLDCDGSVRRPRWAAGFRGTLKYAPISTHISREQCRKDDLETWLYMLVDITSGELPWSKFEDLNTVCHAKERARTTETKLFFADCPQEYEDMISYIDTLRYYDDPIYAVLENLLEKALSNGPYHEHPYDWE